MKLKKTILCTLQIIFIIVVFTLLSAVIRNHLNVYLLADNRVSAEIEYADGRYSEFAEPNGLYFGNVEEGDVVTLHINLPSKPLITDGALVFSVYSSTVDVIYHNEILGTYGHESAIKGRMVGTQYCNVSIPDSLWGDEFTIKLCPTEKDALDDFPSHLYIYPKEMSYAMPLRSQPISFFISVILLVFSFLGLIACLFENFSFPKKSGFVFAL